jgi:hypothetical protein
MAHIIATAFGGKHFATVEYLLTYGGAIFMKTIDVWDMLHTKVGRGTAPKITSLLKIMTLQGDATPWLIAHLSPEDVNIAEKGRQLREWLPAYVKQQHAALVAHCPLPRRSCNLS